MSEVVHRGMDIEVYQDCNIAVIPGDISSSSWVHVHRRLDADRGMLDRLIPLIHPAAVSIDAGACIGCHTFEYLKHSPEVWAFEPSPVAYQCLLHNCPKANCVNAGLAADHGTMYWRSQYPNAGGSFLVSDPLPGDICVSVRPLDWYKFDGRRIGFIKVDVEGMECQFLKGAARIIAVDRPNMCLEVNTAALARNHATPAMLLEMLHAMKYKTEPVYPGTDTHDQWDVIARPGEAA